MSVLLQPELYYEALPAPHLGNEGSYMHSLILPLTPRVWTNKNELLPSLVTVQLKVMLPYLSPTPWFTSWCLSIRGAMERRANRKDTRVQGYTSEALWLQSRQKEEGRREGRHQHREQKQGEEELVCCVRAPNGVAWLV